MGRVYKVTRDQFEFLVESILTELENGCEGSGIEDTIKYALENPHTKGVTIQNNLPIPARHMNLIPELIIKQWKLNDKDCYRIARKGHKVKQEDAIYFQTIQHKSVEHEHLNIPKNKDGLYVVQFPDDSKPKLYNPQQLITKFNQYNTTALANNKPLLKGKSHTPAGKQYAVFNSFYPKIDNKNSLIFSYFTDIKQIENNVEPETKIDNIPYDLSNYYKDNMVTPIKPNGKPHEDIIKMINQLKQYTTKGYKITKIEIKSSASNLPATNDIPDGYSKLDHNYNGENPNNDYLAKQRATQLKNYLNKELKPENIKIIESIVSGPKYDRNKLHQAMQDNKEDQYREQFEPYKYVKINVGLEKRIKKPAAIRDNWIHLYIKINKTK